MTEQTKIARAATEHKMGNVSNEITEAEQKVTLSAHTIAALCSRYPRVFPDGPPPWTSRTAEGVSALLYEMGFEVPHRNNDALVFGEIPDALLDREITLATGPRKDWKVWKNHTGTLLDWLGQWSHHKESSDKDGPSFLQGAVSGGERKAAAVTHLDILSLDCDCGDSIDEVRAKLQAHNLFGVIYTTFSHGKDTTECKKDAVVAWSKSPDPTADDVSRYLREVKRYRPHVLEGCMLLEEEHTSAGVQLVLRHQPMNKFRVVLLLKDRVVIAKRPGTQKQALAEWSERYMGAARMFDVFADRACIDSARLFFAPRHPPGANNHLIHVIAGKPLDWEALPRITAQMLKDEGRDEFEVASKAMGTGTGDGEYATPGLKLFAKRYVARFDFEDMMAEFYDDRGAMSSGPGHCFECPFDSNHGNAGDENDAAFWAISASNADPGHEKTEGTFNAGCRHDSCSGHDRLAFLDRVCQDNGIEDAEELRRWCFRVDGDPDYDTDDKTPAAKTFKPLTEKAAREAIGALKPDADGFSEDLTTFFGGLGASIATGEMSRAVAESIISKHTRRLGMTKPTLMKEINVAARDAGRGVTGVTHAGLPEECLKSLHALNNEYGVISHGNSVRVMRLLTNDEDPLVLYRTHEFYELEANQRKVPTGEVKIDGTPVMQPAARAWNEWDERRTYKQGIVFDPSWREDDSIEARRRVYNLWRGFAHDGKTPAECGVDWEKSLLRAHMRDNVCRGNEAHLDWLDLWIADIFQHPDAKKGSSVVVSGKKGTGKTILFEFLRAAIGKRHSIKVANKEHLTGRFNGHQYAKLFMLCEEAMWAGDKGAAGVLKDLITSSEHVMEKKGVDAVTVENHIRLAFTSNEKWVVPATLDDERRFFVLMCGDARRGDTDYFGAIDAEMKAGGLEAMAHFYRNYKPKAGMAWNDLRKPPVTPWLKEQGAAGLESDDVFFREMVTNRGCATVLLPGPKDFAEPIKGFHINGAETLTPMDESALNGSPLHLSEDGKRQYLPFALVKQHYEHWLGRKGITGDRQHRLTDGRAMGKMMETWLCADPEGTVKRTLPDSPHRQRCYVIPLMEEITDRLLKDRGIEIEHPWEFDHTPD